VSWKLKADEPVTGFKNLTQAQILSDSVYYSDTPDPQPWVVYYISRPLVGTPEAIKYTAPTILQGKQPASPTKPLPKPPNAAAAAATPKKEVTSFGDLMNQFPMIAKQMAPGLERIFNEFKREVEKPLPQTPTPEPPVRSPSKRRRLSVSSITSLSNSVHSSMTNGVHGVYQSHLDLNHQEEELRHALEVAITAAIDLFQMVDKQQLSLLGSTTDLTGAMVERMIERYITEHLHDTILFPKLSASRKKDDAELESRVRQMVDIDISQVGLSIETGRAGKKELALRLTNGVNIFKRMGVTSSPHEMLEVLLETEKAITQQKSPRKPVENAQPSEKEDAIMNISADTLVSLLLVVVIRSPVRHLQARLLYMRHFVFIDDVESGEVGYALSTFEAVLSYLSHDSNGLRRSSLRNKRLWHATKAGNIAAMREILEPDSVAENGMEPTPKYMDELSLTSRLSSINTTPSYGGITVDENNPPSYNLEAKSNGNLAHVFPFQRPSTPSDLDLRPRMKKRVFVKSRSTSISSVSSLPSLPLDSDDVPLDFDGDLSMETLAQTQGPDGDSVLMMAIHSEQDRALKYLLNMRMYFPLYIVLDDENNIGTTLFSAAVQSGNRQVADMVLDFVIENQDTDDTLSRYISRQDENGRCAAHFLFDYPGLMSRISNFIPWTLKDKNGQTPLFALCRSYDHEDYKWMIETAIAAATKAQADSQRLRLNDHVDSKGNTLLHIINEPTLAAQLLSDCDSDVNAANDKQFTPLMVASKYGRTEMVRTLFSDPRVDLYARDLRGLTATELAKDDEVRNRIDDLVLLSSPPTFDKRVTAVVRSYFVEDGTVRFIIKSAAKNPNSTVTITTCRRTLSDFEDLAEWLSLEHPASWLPKPTGFLSAFLLPTRPSRSIARDTQLRLDSFLKILLSHSTFSTHEMVWEFFLVPDMDPSVLIDRSKQKAIIRTEMVRDDYEPVTDVREVELFVAYARDSIRSLSTATKSVLRRTSNMRLARSDLYDAYSLAGSSLLSFRLLGLDDQHRQLLRGIARCFKQPEHSPFTAFFYDIHAISSTISALITSFKRPTELVSQISNTRKQIDRAAASYRRATDKSSFSLRPLGLQILDDARARATKEAAAKMDKAVVEQQELGKELRYTQQVVAQEMAAWQEERVGMGRQALKALARRMVVGERERLEALKRAGRTVGMEFGEDGKRIRS
jgi:ankyrin repeat protein